LKLAASAGRLSRERITKLPYLILF